MKFQTPSISWAQPQPFHAVIERTDIMYYLHLIDQAWILRLPFSSTEESSITSGHAHPPHRTGRQCWNGIWTADTQRVWTACSLGAQLRRPLRCLFGEQQQSLCQFLEWTTHILALYNKCSVHAISIVTLLDDIAEEQKVRKLVQYQQNFPTVFTGLWFQDPCKQYHPDTHIPYRNGRVLTCKHFICKLFRIPNSV